MKRHIKYTTFIGIIIALFLIAQDSFAAIQIKSEQHQLIAPEATSYQWYANGQLLDEAIDRTITIEKSGTYTVAMKDHEGNIKTQQIQVVVEDGEIHQVFVIGDSTASFYSSSRAPRTGWAQVLQPFFNGDSTEVVNKALSGRSSKSFHTDPAGWPVVLQDLEAGDYLFIQFGHNDSKSDDPDRYTEPYTTYQEYLSIYIDTALARNAHPVLLTPIHRNSWAGSNINDTHGDYPDAMRELAAEKNIPLIDLHQKTEKLFETLGETYTTNQLFMNLPADTYVNYPDGNNDNTHLQEEGAFEVSKLVKEGIRELDSFPQMDRLASLLQTAAWVSAKPEPALSGRISGTGVVPFGADITLEATPTSGYAFVKWKNESGDLSDNPEYTVKVSDTTLQLTAVFDVGYRVSVDKEPYGGGDIEGEGSYLVGAEVTLEAIPNDGYVFAGWVLKEDTVSTETVYTFTLDEEDVELMAIFEAITSSADYKRYEDINIFPNPTSDYLFIWSAYLINNIEVFDMQGNLLEKQAVNNNHIQLSLQHYASSLLIIKMVAEDHMYCKKILVE